MTPGQNINGKYVVEHVLGEGGMGVVVAARHLALGQRVAIKFLHTRLLSHAAIVERFKREARAASRMESDHVARVTDVDVLADGTPFMVMEFLEGADLSRVRQSGRPLDIVEAVRVVLDVCEAVAEAHRLGIIHRDIKPANIFRARRADGRTRIKLLDFGISKMSGDGEVNVTKTSSFLGSAEYMSPEQMLGTRDVDARADVWSLGVTLYELVTCRVPFPGENIAQVCATVMSVTPVPPCSLRPDLPPSLSQVILRCLEKNRDTRVASATELASLLQPFATSTGAASPPEPLAPPLAESRSDSDRLVLPIHSTAVVPSNAVALPSPATTAAVSSSLAPIQAKRRWRGALPLALSLAALLGVGSLYGLNSALRTSASTGKTTATPKGSQPIARSMEPPSSPSTAGVSAASPAQASVVSPLANSAARSDVPSVTSSNAAPISASVNPKPSTVTAPTNAPPTSKPPTPAAAPNCNPPYTYDAAGIKRVKPQCL